MIGTEGKIGRRATLALFRAIERDPEAHTRVAKAEAQPVQAPPRLSALIEASEHAVVDQGGGRLCCSRCAGWSSKRKAAKWLATPCTSPVASRFGPVRDRPREQHPSDLNSLHLGHQEMHHTHALAFHTDVKVWFCRVCGNYASQAARSLVAPCTLRASRKGAQNLQRLAKGLYPGDSQAARKINDGLFRSPRPSKRR